MRGYKTIKFTGIMLAAAGVTALNFQNLDWALNQKPYVMVVLGFTILGFGIYREYRSLAAKADR